ncbi:MAG: DUF6279 family lipoprotein [Pseudomonadota bacterium]|nr:DUF6279 family lipoprotein [Pseudomonadota bacterium]|tara:strand:- start:35 stop:862 length:828 start_codon:yes stop_codon:yes gene_type:complete
MIGKGYKKIIVILVFLTLPACSVVGGLWYERIDQLIANQFLEYASFTNDQEKYVRQATLEFKYWNIKNELPKYKKLIAQFRSLDNATTVDDIDDIYQQGMILANNTREFFLPQIVEFCKTITNKQVEEMATYFDDLMKERKLELENDEDDLQGSLIKSFKRFFRFMGVKLSNEQINTIQTLSSGIEDKREQLISERIQWNQQFIAILELRQNENFEERFISHINSLDSEDPKTRIMINKITAEIIASLSEKQRGKFQKRLVRFESSIDQIIEKQN